MRLLEASVNAAAGAGGRITGMSTDFVLSHPYSSGFVDTQPLLDLMEDRAAAVHNGCAALLADFMQQTYIKWLSEGTVFSL